METPLAQESRRPCNVIKNVHDIAKFRKAKSDNRYDRPGLGANHEDSLRHRHKPRWQDMPRSHYLKRTGIPCVIGTEGGTEKIPSGQDITVDCSQGEKGFVYKGKLKFHKDETDIKNMPTPRTKIMMNVGIPENAFEQSFIPNDGVGLARRSSS